MLLPLSFAINAQEEEEKKSEEKKKCDHMGCGMSCMKGDTYYTGGGEIIFSMADSYINGSFTENEGRFAPFLNFNIYAHRDFTDHFGFFHGIGLKNVGFIQDRDDISQGLNNAPAQTKHRTYNATLPLGFKVGDVDKFYFYAGYEFEYAFNYREKVIIGGEKEGDRQWWFSERVNQFQHGVFVGVQFPWDMNIKFKYYVSDFFNKGFVDYDAAGNPFRPYGNFDANVFSVSLDFSMFKRDDKGKSKHSMGCIMGGCNHGSCEKGKEEAPAEKAE